MEGRNSANATTFGAARAAGPSMSDLQVDGVGMGHPLAVSLHFSPENDSWRGEVEEEEEKVGIFYHESGEGRRWRGGVRRNAASMEFDGLRKGGKNGHSNPHVLYSQLWRRDSPRMDIISNK